MKLLLVLVFGLPVTNEDNYTTRCKTNELVEEGDMASITCHLSVDTEKTKTFLYVFKDRGTDREVMILDGGLNKEGKLIPIEKLSFEFVGCVGHKCTINLPVATTEHTGEYQCEDQFATQPHNIRTCHLKVKPKASDAAIWQYAIAFLCTCILGLSAWCVWCLNAMRKEKERSPPKEKVEPGVPSSAFNAEDAMLGTGGPDVIDGVMLHNRCRRETRDEDANRGSGFPTRASLDDENDFLRAGQNEQHSQV